MPTGVRYDLFHTNALLYVRHVVPCIMPQTLQYTGKKIK